MDKPPCSAAFSFPPVVPPAMDEEQVDEEQVDEEQVDEEQVDEGQVDEEHLLIASEELSPVEIEERGPGLGDLQYDEARTLAQTVVSMGDQAGESLPRAYLALGLCCSLQASDAALKSDRDHFNKRALKVLQKAHSLDPQDSQILMYLSLQLALVRQVSASMEPLQRALCLRGEDLNSLHLLVLVLSAQKHHRHALDTATLALSQHPDNFK
uniref:Uncharacterized protein n=1 Tax=Knipowitschia caucasica TaxID=637954 RepID=A0AAV2JGL2_KNICA